MSFWELVERSPEWVGVFANALFALITIGVLIWQVCVMRWQARLMKWQGRNSARHERTQNNLFRLQLEHELILRLNAERQQLLGLTEGLQLVAGCLKEQETAGDSLHWSELRDRADELHKRLRILDLRTYSDAYGKWFPTLEAYVDAVLKLVIRMANLARSMMFLVKLRIYRQGYNSHNYIRGTIRL